MSRILPIAILLALLPTTFLHQRVVLAATPDSWMPVGDLDTARYDHTASLLPDGSVLVVGGQNAGGRLKSVELFQPQRGLWVAVSDLNSERYDHTATVLANGTVLVAGGRGNVGRLNSAERFDPQTGAWTPVANLNTARERHTATLLPNNEVLVVGGVGTGGLLNDVETYKLQTDTWTTAANMNTNRYDHTATLLPDGRVLVTGGVSNESPSSAAEIYDAQTNTWTSVANMTTERYNHSATLLPNGLVLVVGGAGDVRSAEIYDPVTDAWTPVADLNVARSSHSATLLPSGKVLVAGGVGAVGGAEVYDPQNNLWIEAADLNTGRHDHTATLLADGTVLSVGGVDTEPLVSAEYYQSAMPNWGATSHLNTARSAHTASLLADGTVLVSGGFDAANSVERYIPAADSWQPVGNLSIPRTQHTATLLPDGTVLVVGGLGSSQRLQSAERYDPLTDVWTPAANLGAAREQHTATLLMDGSLLVVGGLGNGGGHLGSVEIYDPNADSWRSAADLRTGRYNHTATLLPDGTVLVAGGYDGGSLTDVEIYDPQSNTWTVTGSLNHGRYGHTATLLPDGSVLVTGGTGGDPSAELYDVETGIWSAVADMHSARASHTATLLPDGTVLIVGGQNALSSAEVYDPQDNAWTVVPDLNVGRMAHTATLLPDGRVIIIGGENSIIRAETEVYERGLGFQSAWQPELTQATSPVTSGAALVVAGTRFQGLSEGSGGLGHSNSSTNYPLVQLQSLANEQQRFLRLDQTLGWSDTSFTSLPIGQFPPTYALVTVFANGIPSISRIVLIGDLATPTARVTFNKVVQDGDALPSSWTFDITDGPQGVSHSETITLNVGTYLVVENGPNGYSAVNATGVCSLVDGEIRLRVDGDGGTCTIVNSLQTGTIRFRKTVSGGSAQPSAWTFDVDGGPSNIDHDQTVTLAVGTYRITEHGPDNYAPVSASGACALVNDEIRLTVTGGNETCTITNALATAPITFRKTVIGGTAQPSNWAFSIIGAASGVQHNQTVTLGLGAYTVTEQGPADYGLLNASGACALVNGSIRLTVQSGGGTCTITNRFAEVEITESYLVTSLDEEREADEPNVACYWLTLTTPPSDGTVVLEIRPSQRQLVLRNRTTVTLDDNNWNDFSEGEGTNLVCLQAVDDWIDHSETEICKDGNSQVIGQGTLVPDRECGDHVDFVAHRIVSATASAYSTATPIRNRSPEDLDEDPTTVDALLRENDAAGVIISPTQIVFRHGTEGAYEVSLATQPRDDVLITIQPDASLTVASGCTNDGAPCLRFSAENWNTPQRIIVRSASPLPRQVQITHSVQSVDNAYNAIDAAAVDVVVENDDAVGVTVTPTQLTLTHGEEATYEMMLTAEPSDIVLINIQADSTLGVETGCTNADGPCLRFSSENWAVPQVVTLRSIIAQARQVQIEHQAGSADPRYDDLIGATVTVNVLHEHTRSDSRVLLPIIARP